ncbi:MAG TPA: S8 family serine peptidase [Pyrinomonadaceae bacterium]
MSPLRLISIALCCLLNAPYFLPLSTRAKASPAAVEAAGAPSAPRRPVKAQASRRPGELLARFRGEAPERGIAALAAELGLTRAGRLRGASGVERLSLAGGGDVDSVLPALRSSELVEFAEPNFVIKADQLTPDDPLFKDQWALGAARAAAGADLNAVRAWRHTTGSPDTVVAVVDSGVDFTHPDLGGNRWANRKESPGGRDDDGDGYVDDLHGWDFVTNSGGGADGGGHGTAVAGIIAAAGNNGEGVSGVMWRAGLMSLRVLDGEGRGSVADAVEAIDYAVAHGARVVNCSWGLDESSASLRQAVERALLSNVTVVTAAGNGGRDIYASPRFPAGYNNPSLLVVAGTTRADELAAWSNWGSGRVTLAAPGEGVLTTKAGGGYELVNGTSAAAALVSGVAGLVRTLRPRLSAARTREVIERGARRAAALNDKVRAGVVDAAGALDSLSILQEGEGVGGGEEKADGSERGEGAPGTRPGFPGPGAGAANAAPAAPVREAPVPGLPNLEELKRSRPSDAQAIPPVPSTRRRCPPHNPNCNEAPDREASPRPTPGRRAAYGGAGSWPGAQLARAAGWSFAGLLASAFNGDGRPHVYVPAAEYLAGASYAVSDSPPALTGPGPGAGEADPGRLTAAAAAVLFDPPNLALGRPTSQSSEAAGGASGRAVDGNTDGNWYVASTTHTDYQPQPWWQVDLGSVQSIGSVRLWNRTDCCADRLSNFYVLVSDQPFNSTDLGTAINQAGVSNYYTAGQAANPLTVPVNRTGRYVRVQLSGANYLSLAEAEVFAGAAAFGETVWVEDSLPGGAAAAGDTDGWNWVGSNPAPYSGSLSHQSAVAGGVHQHFFYGAASTLGVGTGESLFAYVYLDPSNPPSEVMLQWNSNQEGWNHRAYWGANLVGWGTDGTGSRRYVGALPAAGGWARLEVPAGLVGAEGKTLNGMAYTLYNGRAWWDRAGKTAPFSNPSPGLWGRYYDNMDFTAFKVGRVDPKVDFEWHSAAPDPSVGADSFTARWTGMVVPRYTQTYTFYTQSDDGVRLWVGGNLVINNWTDHGWTTDAGTIALEAGVPTPIKMEFYENGGGAIAKLEWGSPSQAREIIPPSQLQSCWKGSAQFVRDFFQGALHRPPTPAELRDWAPRLTQAQGFDQLRYEAAALGRHIFNSAEYLAHNPSDNQHFVSDCYWGYLQRGPDAGGLSWWTGQANSYGRAAVLPAFEQSVEFGEKSQRTCDAAAAVGGGDTGYSFSTARLDPDNRTGGQGVDPLSRNFNWSAPVVGLPGRAGLDLGLSLSYNSLVWTKDAGGVTFDADEGFPGPGFRLGFPTVQPRFFNPQTGRYTYLLLTPAGARVELRQVGTSNVYESADSNNMQLTEAGGGLSVLTADGTRLGFSLVGGAYRCQETRDRNGNYLSAAYYGDGRLSSVTDTLGRVVTFNYDANLNLLSVTQPWKRETETGSVQETHTWASFGYANLTLQPQFSNLAVVGEQPGTVIPVLSQVGLADGSYYKFSYNQWGQVWKVTHFAADSVVNGAPQDTHPLTYTRVNLPGSDLLAASPQADCPRFAQSLVWIENGVMGASGEVATSYSAWSPGMASCDTTAPDGTLYRDFYGAGWRRGLTTQSEVWSAGQRRKWTTFTWEHDGAAGASYPTNPRVNDTNVYDAEGNRRRTGATFTSFGLPWQTTEYKADGATPLRTTVIDYDLRAEYTGARIIGLPSFVRLYEGGVAAANLRSKTGHVYDDDTLPGYLQALPAAATQHYGQTYGTGYRWRGNLSRVRRYEVNQLTGAESGASTEVVTGYYVTGSPAFVRDAGGHQASLGFADAFFDNVPRNTFAYPTVATDGDGFTSTTWYNYDMGVMTRTQSPRPNETSNLPGPETRRLYDRAGRQTKAINVFNNSHTEWVYPDTNTSVQTFTTVEDASLSNPALRAYSATLLDGAGRERALSREQPGSAGGFSGQLFYRDAMGRTVRTYNPTETDANWNVTGDDAAAGWVYTGQSYDWQGRPTVTTNQDGTTREMSYGGCGCAGGEVVTEAGEVVQLPPQGGSGSYGPDRRRRRTYHDVLGRPFKSMVLNRDGTPYRTTVTTYDARDNVVSVREYKGADAADGSCALGTCQVTTSAYDGYGRLQSQKFPQETSPTTYAYNPDDTVQQEVDPRGATSTYAYNNGRHLVSSITYGAPYPVTATPASVFTYDAAGNRKTQTDQGGSSTYQYDGLGRLTSEARTFNGLGGSYPLVYTYNLADQLASITDPAGQTINYDYDKVGNLEAMTGSSYGNVTQYASGMKYRAWGAVKEWDLGNGLRMSQGYDTRQRLRRYHVRRPTAPAGTADLALGDYEYEADGRVGTMYDRTDPGFDRSYTYDLVGRLAYANTASSAFYQSYGYDEFGHMTYRGNGSWRFYENTFSQYRNNRNISTQTGPPAYPTCCPPPTVVWQYDAAGNVTQDHNKKYFYDAAGNKVRAEVTTVSGFTERLWIYQDYDADGEPVKRVEQRQSGSGPYSFVHTHYVRSSVLDGKVVTELDQFGAKRLTYVRAEQAAVAKQAGGEVYWVHTDPVTGSLRESNNGGFLLSRFEYDPLGDEVPLTDPAPPEEQTPDYEYAGGYGDSGNPYDGASGCTLDGQPVPCSLAMSLVNIGAAAQCPNNYCGPRHNGRTWEFLYFTDKGLYYSASQKKARAGSRQSGGGNKGGKGRQKKQTRPAQPTMRPIFREVPKDNCFLNAVSPRSVGVARSFDDAHDGYHARGPGEVITLSAMDNGQVSKVTTGDDTGAAFNSIIDIKLPGGKLYVLLKDVGGVTVRKDDVVKAGQVLGKVNGGSGKWDQLKGLHFALIRAEYYDRYRELTPHLVSSKDPKYAESKAELDANQSKWFVDPLTSSESPFRCPGVNTRIDPPWLGEGWTVYTIPDDRNY